MPELQPLLQYLRCEEVPLNQFGEAQKPMEALKFLIERLPASRQDIENKGEREDDEPRVSIEVWPGKRAELQFLAGYGFFGIVQFYDLKDKAALTSSLAAAGWHLKRSPYNTAESLSPAIALVPVHKGSRPMGDTTRKLTLMEARVDYMTQEIDLHGLTLVCEYGKKSK